MLCVIVQFLIRFISTSDRNSLLLWTSEIVTCLQSKSKRGKGKWSPFFNGSIPRCPYHRLVIYTCEYLRENETICKNTAEPEFSVPPYFWKVTQTCMFKKKFTDQMEFYQNMFRWFLEDKIKIFKPFCSNLIKIRAFLFSWTSMFPSPYRFYATENVGSTYE